MSKFLFDLITGMTTSEKVHFMRHAKVHGDKSDKNYLIIYEAVSRLKTYDKKGFTNLFKGTTIEKYLSSEVDYLKEKLLISLFNYNLNRTKRNQIQKGILLVEVLTNKGFRKEALKKLNFIKKTAIKQEEFTWVLRLIELEEQILFKEGILGYKDNLKLLREQRNKVTGFIQNLNDYQILREEVREFQFSEHLDIKVVSEFIELCNNPLVLNKENCMSIRAKEHWYYIQVLANYLKRNFGLGLSFSAKYVEFMSQNLHLFDLSKMLPGLSNYIYHGALTSDKYHFSLGQKILLSLSHRKELSASYVKYITHTRNLEFAYYAKDSDLTAKYLNFAIKMFEEDLQNLEESQVQYLFMVIVRSTIILNQTKSGMYFINQWLQRGVLPYRKVQARLFSIIIHLELDYMELISSEIIILKKLEKNNPREKLLINTFYSFVSKLVKHPYKKESLIEKFQQELEVIAINIEGYFDFISFDYYQWSLSLISASAKLEK